MIIKEVVVEPGDRWLTPGDIHFDIEDRPLIDVMLRCARAEKVNGVALIGDTFESAGISRHKSMRHVNNFRHGLATIKAEKRAAEPVFRELERIAKPGKRHALCGNHDGAGWWSEVQNDYPGLLDTPLHELYGELFDGWHVHGEETALKMGPLLLCHGHRLRGSLSKNSAAAVLANYPGQNTLYGHTHRIDQATTPTFKYGRQSANGAWTIGHMKDRYKELADRTLGPFSERHQQGFAITSFFDRGDGALGFNVEIIRAHRDHDDKPFVVVNGKVYR